MPRPCPTEDCKYTIPDGSDFDKCAYCRRHDDRWSGRKMPDLIERHRQLSCWDHRMLPLIKETKVTRISDRRRKRA